MTQTIQVVERCDHSYNAMSMACTRCGLTAEAIAMGRDVPATWDDVDAAHLAGFKSGHDFAHAYWRHDGRRRWFLIGARFALRKLRA